MGAWSGLGVVVGRPCARVQRALFVAAVWCALVAPAAARATSSSAYVTNYGSNDVSQFDVGAGGVLAPKTPARVAAGDAGPTGVAVSPDGRSVYVTDPPNNDVSQFNVGPGGVLLLKTPATAVAGTTPYGVAVSPDGKSVYVTNLGDGTVSQYDVGPGGVLSPKTPATVVAGGSQDIGIAVSPDGRSVYVADSLGGTVSMFDVGAGGVLSPKTPATVAAGLQPVFVAVSPDGRSVYVTDRNGNAVSMFDVGAGGLLSPKTPTRVAAGTRPQGVAVSPDGRSVYVASQGDNHVLQFDVGAGGVLSPKTPATVAVGAQPYGLVVSPDGKSVYVANSGSSNVSQLDVGAGGLLSAKTPTALGTGTVPSEVAVLPDQGPSASFVSTPAQAFATTRFDGSSSSDADGTIARYDWSFGDGTVLRGGGATPTHTYTAAGTYTARLTVTDDGGCSSLFVFTGQTAYCNGSAAASTTHTITVRAGSPPVTPRFAFVGSVTPSPAGVRLTLRCQAAPGATCRGLGQLTTLERLVGQKIVSLAAGRKHHTRRVRVGSLSFSLAAGQTARLVIALNATGRRLLARFGRIPATLTISLLNTNARTGLSTNTTIKAKRNRKRHKRH